MNDYFHKQLEMTTDPSDVHADFENGVDGFILIDARSPESFAREHVPGAINLPHRTISAETTASFDRAKTLITYCDGNGCNGSTKAAAKLSELGFRVKEMLGGIDWWKRDGYDVHGTAAATPALRIACGC